ncbi:hypothetical protein YWY31_29510 [Paenibacillus illinoisensis]|uniref:hypothetical protein n=1 Tax=Paenibacillus TaxID=44249 RepID=UPI00203B7F42|nr:MULTISPECIES: hypothetical protein [Paenibacillus]MCM3207850.1 hypothetical protein [Paenibacillus illinoisensis]WJH28707.1 hypothetical protein N6H13_27685 [Paenibacillus sp. CC-CFT742]
MNLADMLTFADIGQLNRIADYYQCECKPNSKHELIQSILTTLGSRRFFEQQVSELNVAHLRFLNNLLFDPRQYFGMEELVAIARQSMDKKESESGASPRDLIVRFTKSGWLFNGTTQHTKYLYQVPQDLKMRFRDVLSAHLKAGITTTNEPPMYRDEYHLLVDDLKLFLQFVQQHEITLNAEGMMYRRSQQQVMDHLHVSETLVGKAGWRFGYGRSFKDYPDRFALLYDYAFHHRLVREEQGLLKLTAAGEEKRGAENTAEMIQLFRFWLRLYKGAIPNLSSIVYWTGECAPGWSTAESLFRQIGPLIQPFYYDTPETIYETRVVKMMLHLGMLRIGEQEGESTVQMTAWGLRLAATCRSLSGDTTPLVFDI